MSKRISSLRQRKKFISFYSNFIQKGDLCFDIGANIGNRTEVFLGLKARVVSVEPVEETYLELQKKFGEYPDSTLLHLGLGSKPGEKDIYISNISQVCTFSEEFIEQYKNQDNLTIEWDSSKKTTVKTLDQLIAEFGVPTFCKIDVEGYELEVLKGLSQPLPLISFEYNAKLKGLALECIETLSQFSVLSYNFSPYESMVFSFESWQKESDFLSFLIDLPDDVKTGDIYVKCQPK